MPHRTMQLDTTFRGRIIQVCEALSYQDAVSNHILALHALFLQLGLKSEVYAKWHDPRLEDQRRPLEALQAAQDDVLLFHFCGRSEHALPVALQAYCTRVMVYHNITPAAFFQPQSRLHGFCVEGREQLQACVGQFHRFWADSAFNLEELIALGADPAAGSVVPIIVPPPAAAEEADRAPGSWLFVGRVAPNKRQVDLVRLFERVRSETPELARSLVLAGGYEPEDPYFRELVEAVQDSPAAPAIRLAGKVTDEERERLYRGSALYVSMSEHEGFGVPLVEAALRGLPVVALDITAVGETMGQGPGLAASPAEVRPLARRVQQDSAFRAELLAHQAANARRFGPGAVGTRVVEALGKVLPCGRPYRKVSVVICTYNRRSYLERVFDYLRHQSHPGFEVIVVDGPSDDGTRELLKRHAHELKLAFNPERNLSKSRNLGIELADGDVVAFIDDDALPFNDWVARILAEYNARPLTTAGLGGPAYYAGTFWFQAEDSGINRFAEAKVNIANGEIGRDGWLRYNTGTNATFATAALRAHGGFDEQFDYYLDESEVCFRLQRAGLLVGYSPDVVVRHEFAQSHNRQGRLNYNWFTICKNTAYFAGAYSGLEGTALRHYLDERMARERISPIDEALAAGDITKEERDRHVKAIGAGIEQGLADVAHYPRRRTLAAAPGGFKPYPVHFSEASPALPARRLHVCIISRELPPFAAGGGVGTLYYHLASELLMMGHRVTAIVPGGEARRFEQGNIRVRFTPQAPVRVAHADGGFERNLAWSVSAMAELAALHAEDPVDIVDSSLWDSEALAVALLPAAQRPKVVVRLVTPFALASQINGWQPDPATAALFMGAERALIEHADAVVPISESIASSVEEIHGIRRDTRWRRIPCGIAYWPFFDVNQGYNEFPQLGDLPNAALASQRLVLFVGRLERRKGVDLIMEAAPAILRADPEAHLVLAGRDVENWATRELPEALRGRVHVVGEIDNPTREKLFARAFCVLFPSRYESFGLVPLEACVHGVPVVAARAGAIPEVVEDGRSGLLFDPESSASLATCVVRLMREPLLHASLAAGARQRVRTLSSRASAQASQDLYRSLLNPGA